MHFRFFDSSTLHTIPTLVSSLPTLDSRLSPSQTSSITPAADSRLSTRDSRLRTLAPRLRTFLLSVLLLFAAIDPAGAQVAPRRADSWIVRLRPGVSLKSARQSILSGSGLKGVTIERAVGASRPGASMMSATGLDRYYVVRATGTSGVDPIAALRLSPLVEYVQPNHIHSISIAPNDSAYGSQWAMAAVDAEGAWRTTRGDSSIIVGVVDTGIDFLHPDLVGSMAVDRAEDLNRNGRFDAWPASQKIGGITGDLDGIDQDNNGLADDVVGFDFIDQSVPNLGDWQGRDAVPSDEQGHGTNTAGVIAATADNGIGISGLAPGVRVLALRAFDATGNGEDDDISAAIVFAADRGVRVLNLSFGDLFYSSLMRDAIRYALLRGVVVVASSGNDGGSGRHYPSNYPGVVSVGAIDSTRRLPFFSTFGSQLSLVAPGVDIVTTSRNARYERVSGTSFSAPHVAAVAALILSIHPTWEPDEVRTAIEITTDDDAKQGWDEFYGSGRLNARRAVEFPGPPLLAIETPEIDSGMRDDRTVVVIGSAGAPFLESWELMIGTGEIPREWTSLGGPHFEGRLHDTLGSFSTRELSDTTLTLRLRMRLTTGRESERRVRLYVDRTAPRILERRIEQVWRYQERAIAITVGCDDLSRLTAWIRPAGNPSEPYRQLALEPERTGLVRDHFLLLSSNDLEPGVRYDLYLALENTTGDTAMVGSPEQPLSVVRSAQTVAREGFDSLPYTLPYGFVLDRIDTIAGRKTVALNRFERGDYGKLMTFAFTDGRFVPRDSVAKQWLPRDFGDSDNDGLRELLVQTLGSTIIYEQKSPGGSILESTMFADTTTDTSLWGSRLHDLDGDGRQELIARTDNRMAGGSTYRVLRITGPTSADTLAILVNPTASAPDESHNNFGPSLSAVGDFDGDGRLEILVGDNDADFLVYERNDDGSYALVWSEENEGEGGSEMIAAADIDGDGRPEIVTGFRSLLRRNAENEFDAPLWTIRIDRLNGDGTATRLWSDRFAYVRPTNPFRSGITAGDLDGTPGEEIALTVFPGFYLFHWDPLAGAIVPIWHIGGIESPGDRTAGSSTLWFGTAVGNMAVLGDFDGDGIREAGIGNGDSIYFFQKAHGPERTDAPTGLRGWSTGSATAHLEWNAVAGATRYIVYRGIRQGGTGAFTLDSIAIVSTTSFEDSTGELVAGREFAYSVVALDLSKPSPASELPGIAIVIPHAPAVIRSIVPTGGRGLRLELTASVRDELYRAAAVDIRHRGAPVAISSVVWINEIALLVTLDDDHSGDTLDIRLASFFRDYFGSPGDTSVAVRVAMPESEEPGERFIATRATLFAPQTIAIDFSDPPGEGALDVAHYRIDSAEAVIDSAYILPGEPRRVYLVISRALAVGPSGRYYSVTITGIRSADGRPINGGAGSVVGLALNAESVEASFVYPQPFSITRDETATIAGLPLGAEVRIFSQNGRLMRQLSATEGNGGLTWNGRDERGEPVPSGIYLYQVRLRSGEESELRKIAVVR